MSSSVTDRAVKTADDCSGGPLPVSAQLIITSPVSSRACFVENQHRRSMCKPLTLPLSHIDDVDTASGGVQISEVLHPVTSSLRRHCGTKLPVVVVSRGDGAGLSNYGRSWYDVEHADKGLSNSGTVIAEPRGYASGYSVAGAGFSLGDDYPSSDTRSVGSHSSLVSDKSSEMSDSLRHSTSQRVPETSALNSGRDEKIAIRINAPSPVLSARPRTLSATGRHSINSTQSADHVSKSSVGVTPDRAVTKGTNLKRLKKSKRGMIGQLKKDTDVDLLADIQRLSRPGAETTIKTTFSGLAAVGSSANDWRWSRENETDSRPVFMSFMSNSLGRHKSLQTCNKFAEHCSTAGNIIVSPQLRTGAIRH